MNEELVRWQEENERQLGAALAWLRERLGAAIPATQPLIPETASVPQPIAAEGPRAKAASSSLPSSNGRAKWPSEAPLEPPLTLRLLAQRLGLSPFEQAVLLLCAAMELDTRIAGLCAAAQGDPGRPFPTFALALTLFEGAAWDALSPERPLRYWRLIEINQPGDRPLTASALRADERIVGYIKGLNYLDDRLGPHLVPFDPPAEALAEPLPPSQEAVVERLAYHLRQAAAGDGPPLVQLVGPDTLGQQLIAQQAASTLGCLVYRMPLELLPSQPGELESLARLWQRESVLLPVILYLDAHDADAPTAEGDPGRLAPLRRFLTRRPGPVFLSSRDVQAGLAPFSLTLEVNKPTPSEQRAAWAGLVEGGEDVAEVPSMLAGQFSLNTATIRRIAHQAAPSSRPRDSKARLTAFASESRYDPGKQLWVACLAHTRPRLSQLAQRLELKATWSDLVLPDEELRGLRQIAAHVGRRTQVYDEWGFRHKMNRGLGISALFAGESGTGKTMAAEVLADELRLDLYRIDLSAVVSKYIGETEKNLRRLFDAAEDGGALLFFDEADALFGRRSEVKDSHDRYANIEINYLLQRMEAYQGLAILATNMKSALDQAFLRRLRFIVNFPFPGPAERQAIWLRVIPPQTPTAGLDFFRLARLNLTGGSIHNIALHAAFLAAQSGGLVTMPLVMSAARAELRKLEKPINETELRL